MKLQINGMIEESEAATVALLIAERGLPEGQVVVERNGAVIKRENWAEAELNEGDRIEILRFVGGG
ncbi:MAG: sulfur carrier protein ThiS [Firmicutes bacterium]|nr:sulfur carrier protein ThiS [Bacillota bacterium]